MCLAELTSVTFVEDEHDPLFLQMLQLFQVSGFGDRSVQLLNGSYDQFIVPGKLVDKRVCVVGAVDASFTEAVKFLGGLEVQIFSIHHENHFVNLRKICQNLGGLERSQRLA